MSGWLDRALGAATMPFASGRPARVFALGLAVAALVSVIATYLAMTGVAPFGLGASAVLWLLYLDIVLVLALGVLVARRVVQVWAGRRRGLAGSRLHVQLVMLFGVVAIAPTIVVALFSALYLNIGIQGWFSDPVRAAVGNSRLVAEAYLREHQQNILAEIRAMAGDLNRDAGLLMGFGGLLEQAVERQVAGRGLSEAIVFDGSGRVLARAGLILSLEFDPVPPSALERARSGEVVLLSSQLGDRVRAVTRVERLADTYLFVGRLVDAQVLGYVDETRRGAQFYRALEGQQSGLQITFALIFTVIALLLLLAASWVGLTLATALTRPIAALTAAAEEVRTGNLEVRVAPESRQDELEDLAHAFNRMTTQLATQQRALIAANQELDHKRRFTEAVLEGVSAGVVGLDPAGVVTLPNRSAATFLGAKPEALIGRPFAEVMPEAADLLEQARRRPDRPAQGQVKVVRARRLRTLLVQVAAESGEAASGGFIVTFDDVTDLLTAQRGVAWADVARRIAHEIKNPLTPIQLAAERLKRKYLKDITNDPEVFAACTDTIVRQVGDIGRMVAEFSAFARMPAPVMREEDIGALLRDVIFLQRQGNPAVTFDLDLPEPSPRLRCDARQLRQVLINLSQNAVDAIEGRIDAGLPPVAGRVAVKVWREGDGLVVEIEDNGRGLPEQGRERLTEPYVTTRAKGTGLGLAIVAKIIEDHQGELRLDDAPGGGARVTLRLPDTPAPLEVADGAEMAKIGPHAA
jgi:two-component system nitrogen regulation sensor histidine kinase NtrY